MKPVLYMSLILSFLLAACNPDQSTPVEETAVAYSVNQQMAVLQTEAVLALTPTITPTPTSTPTATFTPMPTATAKPTITPTWIKRGKGVPIIAPILLYHHIRDTEKPGRYDISPAVFENQLIYLKSWGYTSVTVNDLANAIRYNDPLPEKPVVISFDDGDIDVYQNALPIMKRLGFIGTFYIVANRLGASDFVTVDQLKEMAASGWEIGSHSFSHQDLTQNHEALDTEGKYSKKVLMDKLGLPINSYAYPFGGIDPVVGQHIAAYGYTNAVGLGIGSRHSVLTIFYLDRLEVRNDYSYEQFAKLLPWSPVSTPPAE
jgi:peptidoglycan/xylan/chitin deacetylase (PgdA/CDA1 family)